MNRHSLGLIVGAVAIAILAGLVSRLFIGADRVFHGRAIAIDGDTLAVEGQRLRLKGIDAPELHQTCGTDGKSACGPAARAALADLVRPGVVCSARASDRYGRPLARCRASGVEDIAEAMVASGHAIAIGCCAAAEAAARSAGLGIWAGPFDKPSDWRRAHPGPPER